ncbi:MAG TPA: HSP20 family small heat-shock protein [Polyangiaceae bacterium]
MAAIMVRKNGSKPAQQGSPTAPAREPARWDLSHAMRDMMGWDPFREMAPFAVPTPSGFVPSLEIKETADGFVFKADVPGVKESDLEVTTTGNRLSISGNREAESRKQTDTYYTYERSYGDFTRSFTLPEGADMSSVHAELKEGVLTVGIHKTAAAQPKKISVQTATKKG